MEMVELSQKEIGALLSLMDTIDLESVNLPLTISELIVLHAKLSASQIFCYERRRHPTIPYGIW